MWKFDKLSSGKTKRFAISGIGLLLMTSILNAKIARLEISGAFFYQSEKAFREIYGNGMKYGIDISRNIWRGIELHLEANYFLKKGNLTFTKERTRVKILPLGANLRYVFLKKKIHLYMGAGLTYNLFEEKNPIGEAKKNKIGFSARLGGIKKIKGLKKIFEAFIIDVYMKYNYCKMKPAEIRIDIGGLDLGMAIGFEF
jgi:hypothetical protein